MSSQRWDFASAADLCRRWSVTRQRAHQLVGQPGSPQPVARVNGSLVWLVAEADDWLEHRELHLARAAVYGE